MSIQFRQVCADGTPRQVLRALKSKKYTLDHEDILLCLQALFELTDELTGELEALRTGKLGKK